MAKPDIASRALIYRPGSQEPEIRPLATPPSLEFLQEAVGGYIEPVPYFTTIADGPVILDCVAFCHEEGKLLGLPYNWTATQLWDAALRRAGFGKGITGEALKGLGVAGLQDILVGPVCVVIGAAGFLRQL